MRPTIILQGLLLQAQTTYPIGLAHASSILTTIPAGLRATSAERQPWLSKEGEPHRQSVSAAPVITLLLLIVCRLIVYIGSIILSSVWLRHQMEKIRKQFGKRVKELRLSRGLSQEKLAFESSLHRTYLGGIERGERNPSLKNIAAIAKALGIPLSQLFLFGDEESGGSATDRS